MNSHSFETVLLAVVGGSVQVVTETLYGLYKAKQAHPSHIRLITTSFGKQAIINAGLLGANGKINQFCHDYNLAPIACSEDDILVVTDKAGNMLNDAKTIEQHEGLADFITDVVRELSQEVVYSENLSIDDEAIITALSGDKKNTDNTHATAKANQITLIKTLTTRYETQAGFKDVRLTSKNKQLHINTVFEKYAIHASIAGGRKSMTFLLGYAMSLFGRVQDKISHVLVDERVENNPDFFYPSVQKDKREITLNGSKQTVDFSEMNVSLAEIPMVRLGANMPDAILAAERSYSETVDIFDRILTQDPELLLFTTPDPQAPDTKRPFKVSCSGYIAWLDSIKMAILCGWAEIENPVEKDENTDLAMLILTHYAHFTSGRKQEFNDLIDVADFFLNKDEGINGKKEFVFGKKYDDDTIEDAIANQSVGELGGMINAIYDKSRTDLKKMLADSLGEQLAAMYTPSRITQKTEYGDSLYQLNIDKRFIHFK